MSWLGSRRGAGWAVGVLAAALLAVAGQRWAEGRPDGDAAAGGAEWIWAALPTGATEPAAFWAVRDFTLEEVPAAVELLALADEEYVAWLNGRRVGSNRYAPGAGLDRYEVAGLLLPGPNRLAFEVRSARGAGGLLAALGPAGGAPRVVTDGSWRVLTEHHAGILPGWQPLDDGEAPHSWGRPPVGRWGDPRPGPLRPLAAEAAAPCAPLAPAARRQQEGATVFDWGREVHGYLVVRRARGRAREGEIALFLTGAQPRRPLGEPEAAVPLVAMPGRREWTDSVPRRFRYATVTGLDSLEEAAVLPLDPTAAARLPSPPAERPAGVFGVEPPAFLTPAEKRVRRHQDVGDPP